jgi:phosphoesterase RecJ-like protein
MSYDTKKQIINKINNNSTRTVAIAMHDSPDGDAIGSAVALEKVLLILGKKVDIILQNRVSKSYSKIIGEHRVSKIMTPPMGRKYDLLILLDCSDPNRTVDDIEQLAKFIITIDHHYGAKPFGNIYLNEEVASTGMILYDIIKDLTMINEEIATALYLTIRSDTGCFKNNNTDYHCHEIASQLLLKGADIQLINDIYETKSLTLLRLMGYTFADIHYDKKYKIVYLTVKIDQIKRAQSNYEEASLLIEYIRGTQDSDIAFLFMEGQDNIRIKSRSKDINVSEIMANYGGGGHPLAAGAMFYSEDVYRSVENVLNYTREYIDNLSTNKSK